MPWVITNGKNYINKNSTGNLTPTKEPERAEKFEDQSSAEQFRRNMPKKMRNLNYKVVFWTPQEDACTNETVAEMPDVKPAVAPVPKTTDSLNIEPEILEFDTFYKTISNFQNFVELANKQRSVLEEGLDRVDAEIMDIEHAIELSHCNVVGGYRYYKMLQEARQRRRTYKNAILRIQILMENNPMALVENNLLGKIKGTNSQKYIPRALPYLFENGEVIH